MKKPKAPCYQCKDRHESCHSSCESYISFTKENKLYTDKVKEARYAELLWGDSMEKRIRTSLNEKKLSKKWRR